MIVQRIKEYLEWKGISTKNAELSAGINQSTLSKAIKNGKAIGTDKLENFLSAFPDLSAEWLLRGRGGMESSDIDAKQAIYDLTIENGRLKKRIAELEGKRGDKTIAS